MGEIVTFSGITRLDLPADRILEDAMGKFDSVIIMGYDKEGEEVFASSLADGGSVLWLLEQCKLKLLKVPVRIDDD